VSKQITTLATTTTAAAAAERTTTEKSRVLFNLGVKKQRVSLWPKHQLEY